MKVKIYNPVYKLEVEVNDINHLSRLKKILEQEGFNVKIKPENRCNTVKIGDWY